MTARRKRRVKSKSIRRPRTSPKNLYTRMLIWKKEEEARIAEEKQRVHHK
jgi:hypothetical protein